MTFKCLGPLSVVMEPCGYKEEEHKVTAVQDRHVTERDKARDKDKGQAGC